MNLSPSLILILALFLTTIKATSQKNNTYSIQTYGVPLLSNLLNVNKSFVELDHEKFEIDFQKENLYEIGLDYMITNNKNIFGIGLSNKQIKYNYSYNKTSSITSFNITNNNDSYFQERFFDLNIAGIRLKYGRELTPRTKLFFILEYNSVIVKNSNFYNNSNVFSSSSSSSVNNIEVEASSVTLVEKRGYFNNYFCPEINFQTEIIKNLSFYYGAKLKFWDSGKATQINIDGYFDLNKEVKPLYRASIKDSQLTYYCGLVYTFNLNKNSKE